MQYITATTVLTALAAVSSLATSVAASALPASIAARSDAATPYPINSTMTWIVPINGVNHTLYGSISSVEAQIKTIDPSWKPRVFEKRDELAARDPAANCCPVGNFNWAVGNYGDLVSTAETIYGIEAYLGVNPNECLEIACTGQTGVWACNQWSDTYLTINSNQIASYAIDIAGDCALSCGQLFSGSNWNTIAHGDC